MRTLSRALERSIAALETYGLRYTERQLYYELCRTVRPLPPMAPHGVLAALAGAAVLAALPAPRGAGRALRATLSALRCGAGLAAGLWAARRAPFTPDVPITEAAFITALAARHARFGAPPGLLPPQARPALPPEGRETDLHDYGLARVLVCQDRSIAQMLRANHLHMELECAILSLDEAMPLPDAVVAMLMRAQGAQALLLHDASPAGLALAAQAAELLELPHGIRARAIGLRPADALRLHLFAARGPALNAEAAWPRWLAPPELVWLRAGRAAELAALRPTFLLRALRRAARATPRRRVAPPQAAGFMSWPEA